jgi:enamine deaminase RidA (YjgF/YER057c/UK114 family)
MMAEIKKIIQPDAIPTPIVYPYSQAVEVQANRLIFIAGQPAMDANSKTVGVGDIAAQTRQVFRNINSVLESIGEDFNCIVELTTFIVGRENLETHRETLFEIYNDLIPGKDYPPDSVVLVEGLYREDFLIEVKAVAALS